MTFGEASGGAAFPGSDKVMHSSLVTAWGDLIFAADTMPEMNHQPGDTVAARLEALTGTAHAFPDTATYDGRAFGAVRAPGALLTGLDFTL